MTGYLDRLVGRTLGMLPTLRPRPRSRFEPAAAGPADAGLVESSAEQDAAWPEEHANRPGPGTVVDRARPPLLAAAVTAAHVVDRARPPLLAAAVTAAHPSQDGDADRPPPDGVRLADVAAAPPVGDWAPWPRLDRYAAAPAAVPSTLRRAPVGGTAVPDAGTMVADRLGHPGSTPGGGTTRGPTDERAAAGGRWEPTAAGPGPSPLDGASRDVDPRGVDPLRGAAALAAATSSGTTAAGPADAAAGAPVHAPAGGDTPTRAAVPGVSAGWGPTVPRDGPGEAASGARAARGLAFDEVVIEPGRVVRPTTTGRPSPLGVREERVREGASAEDAPAVSGRLTIQGTPSAGLPGDRGGRGVSAADVLSGPGRFPGQGTPPASASSVEPAGIALRRPEAASDPVPRGAADPAARGTGRPADGVPVGRSSTPRAGLRPGQPVPSSDGEVPAHDADGAVPARDASAQVVRPVVVPDLPGRASGYRTRTERPPEGRPPDPPAPRVTVTIGRVEVRTPPVPPPVAPDPDPGPRQLSLDAYLDRRNSGTR